MKTRSRKNNDLEDDRGTDSEDSSYTNSSLRRRKRVKTKISNHLPKYRRTLNLDMTRSQFSEKNLMSVNVKRERRVPHKEDSVSAMPTHSSSNQVYVNGSDNVDEKQNVRRSTRRRKFTYDNLNQTWLLASSIPDFSKLEPLFSNDPPNPNEDQCETQEPRRSERNRNHELRRLGLSAEDIEFDDMYSRVKRERRKSVHGFYQRRVSQDVGSMADTEETDHNETSDSESMDDASDIEEGIGEEESQENDGAHSSKYSLRPKKPITDRFQFPIERTRPRRSPGSNLFDLPSHHRRPMERDSFKSPAHRSPLYRRKRHAIHHTSTSSSSDDERRFEKRKARSMARARNRCLPVNFCEDDLAKGVIRERMKIGSSLADIDPMNIDRTITFENIGGLDHHIQSLKEMILFPLMYPEVFERFKIAPPRGVLFHGQPGTGKTLVARALANECSQGDRRVAFFMRKGADCLSKWVGESERQLRLLFDQAYQLRPSIIFFDEIDGLAPVRSTRQDQIHSSIVSTLLALMDGLDNRGEIVIIGATNRIDAIDPALRRPGRFDRELLFPLPSLQARQKILKIIVKHWSPPLPDSLIEELAARSVGYCGADLKALCAESALVALRRRYPQIYESRQKLQLDVNTIQVNSEDFFNAMQKIMPTVQRATVFSPSPLPEVLKPLLERMLRSAMQRLRKIFPVASMASKMAAENGNKVSGNTCGPCGSSGCCGGDVSIYECCNGGDEINTLESQEVLSKFSRFSRYLWPFVHRPRFLLSGSKGQGQGSLAPAILYILENVPVHRLDVPALYAVTCRAPEEACAHIFQEAQRNLPSIIFLPHIGYWWETLSDTVRATFVSLLHDLEPCVPVMLLATSDCPYFQLPSEVQDIFSISSDQVMHMDNPSDEERKKFFSVLLKDMLIPPAKKVTQEKQWEPLPVAPPAEPRKLTDAELEKLRQREEATLRELRLFLREILTKLARDRRFSIFTRPVDPGEVPDYREVIKNPMDLETMMTKIDLHRYECVAQFLTDIDLVCHNALEYNPDRDPSDKLIRHRACALKDTAHALVLSELDGEFEKICQEIHQARKKRGESPSKYVPKSYHVLPRPEAPNPSSFYEKENVCDNSGKETNVNDSSNNSLPHSCTTRYSKRIRGLGASSVTATSELSIVKKVDECFVPPKRATQYMIWRRKKSPWFGSCRRKLIRRRVAYAEDIPPKRLRKNASLSREKRCKSLSPILENPSQEKLKEKSPVKDMSSGACKQTSKINLLEDPNIHSPGVVQRNCRQIRDGSPNTRPEIVLLTAVKEKPSGEITCCSTSKCNTASNCDKNSDCSKIVCNKRSCLLGQELEKVETKGKHGADTSANEDRTNPEFFEQSSCVSRQEVDINKNALENFSKCVVNATEGCTVDALQQLFSVLQHCIYRHRQEWNKSDLIQDLEKEVKKFCQSSLS